MSVAALEPRIRQILSAPGTDLETISAKRVRKQLLKVDASLTEDWIKANKVQIDELIAGVFEAISGVTASHAANGGAEAGSVNEDDGDAMDWQAKVEEDGEEGEGNAGPSSSMQKLKKTKTKQELTDEQLARQLSTELNASNRASRSGKVTNGKSKKGASRTPKKDKKSADFVEDSDADSGDDGAGVKKRKKAKGGGGGGAKGGFGKEYLLSAPLATLLNVDRLSRPQVVKQLWEHIKGNELQNPSNRREILCDDGMRAVFNTEKIDMFKMNKVLGDHLHEPESI